MAQSDPHKFDMFRRLLRTNESDPQNGLSSILDEKYEDEEANHSADTLSKSPKARTQLIETSATLAIGAMAGELESSDPSSGEDAALRSLEKSWPVNPERSPVRAGLAERGDLARESTDAGLQIRVPSLHYLGRAIMNAVSAGDDRFNEVAAAVHQVYSDPEEAFYELCLRFGYDYIHPVTSQTPSLIYQTAHTFYDSSGDITFTQATTSGLVCPKERLGEAAFARQFDIPLTRLDGKDDHRELNFTNGVLNRATLRAHRYYEFALDTTAKALLEGYETARAHGKGALYVDYAAKELAKAFELRNLEISAVETFPIHKRLITRLRPGHALLSMRGPARKNIIHGLVIASSESNRTPLRVQNVFDRRAFTEELAFTVIPNLVSHTSSIEAIAGASAVAIALRLQYEGARKWIGDRAYERVRLDIGRIQSDYESEPHHVLKRAGHSMQKNHAIRHAETWVNKLLEYARDPGAALPRSV
ncbi:MAG: hypothetical protein ACYCX6_03280 [Vulcanimicrobiaceae bacterium]